MTADEKVAIFFKFLKNEGALSDYIIEYYRDFKRVKKLSIRKYVKLRITDDKRKGDLISGAFPWSSTKGCYTTWPELSRKWRKISKELYND